MPEEASCLTECLTSGFRCLDMVFGAGLPRIGRASLDRGAWASGVGRGAGSGRLRRCERFRGAAAVLGWATPAGAVPSGRKGPGSDETPSASVTSRETRGVEHVSVEGVKALRVVGQDRHMVDAVEQDRRFSG